METITDNIKDKKTKEYFDQIVNGEQPDSKLTTEEYESGIEQVMKNLDSVIADARETAVRYRLGEIPDAISFSYIARKYFGKSRGWLMQKVNGNTVNGKQASLTESERVKFKSALLDISEKLSAAARNF